MIALLNYGMQKRFVLYSFLIIFAMASFYVLWTKVTEQFAEKIVQEVAVEITKKATTKLLSELSDQIVDLEVLRRVKDLPIKQDLLVRLMQDILAIQAANNTLADCEQYALRVKRAGMYPILQTTREGRPEIKSYIRLNIGDVWRYGSTAFDEQRRYPGGIYFVSKDGSYILSDKKLKYYVEFKATMMQVLIEEKIKIYSYPLLSECITRVETGGELLFRSPGNKVFK